MLRAARAMFRSGVQSGSLSRAAPASQRSFIDDRRHADINAQVKEVIATQTGHQVERQAPEDQAAIASLRVQRLNLPALVTPFGARMCGSALAASGSSSRMGVSTAASAWLPLCVSAPITIMCTVASLVDHR
jgi:hypothetical protein